MIDAIQNTLLLMLTGGLAASVLLMLAVCGVFLGLQGSMVRPSRRLPQDSDGKLLCHLILLGAVIGAFFAAVGGFDNLLFALPTMIASFAIGNIFAARKCGKLNKAYLARAYENVERGDYSGAIEDAKEVARSSERYRAEANQLVGAAQGLRSLAPLDTAQVQYSATEIATPV